MKSAFLIALVVGATILSTQGFSVDDESVEMLSSGGDDAVDLPSEFAQEQADRKVCVVLLAPSPLSR